MGNNYDSKKLSMISISIMIVAGLILGYFIYITMLKSPASNTDNSPGVQLKTDQFKSLTEIKGYGQKVTSTEPGYGRSDPFAPVTP